MIAAANKLDAAKGSRKLLLAQIRAGQVFPVPMQAWMDRHYIELPRPRVRKSPRAASEPKRGPKRRRGTADPMLVLNHVSEREGVPVEDIVGPSHSAATVEARRRAARILRRLRFGLTSIGEALNRHHTSVHNLLHGKPTRERAGK
ncbi:MAG: hypothetical protein EON59_05670 [Alphaproteobacteria bacterium]|nr:MAG: hypothetical protein EON59_05670 [Alphaproteobacteria bacterium]